MKLASEAPPVDRQWRQMRTFLTNVSKIEALANLSATSNINKRFLKDLVGGPSDLGTKILQKY